MTFHVIKKSTRRIVGTLAAIFITSVMIYGFLDSYANTKNQFVKKVDLVEVAIFADKPAGAPPLYEAVATEECIKQITFDVISASAFSASSAQTSSQAFTEAHSSAPSLVAISATKASSQSIKKIQPPPEPPLVAAASPSCIAPSVVPVGYEKLGTEGFVMLELNLAKNGRVERGEIVKSSGFAELDIAALKQVSDAWRFEPCKKAGKAVACKQRIRFRWQVK